MTEYPAITQNDLLLLMPYAIPPNAPTEVNALVKSI